MRHRTLIHLVIAFLTLAVVVGAYVFWYLSVGSLSAKAAAISVEIQTKSQESARVAAAKVALESLREDEAAMQAYLVRQEDIVPFLTMLESTGTSLGSSVEVVSVSAESTEARNKILLSLKISGSFDSVLRTLGAIEYGPYDSAIQNITFDTVLTEEVSSAPWTAVATFMLGTQKPNP